MARLRIGAVALVRPYECFDWSDLLQFPKRGEDRILPGLPGREVQPRVIDAVRAVLHVRLYGNLGPDGQPIAGGEPVWHDNLYVHLAVLHGLASTAGTLPLQLSLGTTTATARCIVEGIATPTFDAAVRADVALDVTLPDGPLVLG